MSSVGKPRKTHGKELKDLGRIFSPLAGDTWRALSPTNRQLRIKRARVIPIRNAWKDPWYFTMWNFGCLTKTQLVLGGLNMSPMRFVYTLDLLNEAWLRQFLTSDSAALCLLMVISTLFTVLSALETRTFLRARELGPPALPHIVLLLPKTALYPRVLSEGVLTKRTNPIRINSKGNSWSTQLRVFDFKGNPETTWRSHTPTLPWEGNTGSEESRIWPEVTHPGGGRARMWLWVSATNLTMEQPSKYQLRFLGSLKEGGFTRLWITK